MGEVVMKHPRLWGGIGEMDFTWDGKDSLHFLFCTWGSRGDIQPNIALGLELIRRGHVVTVMGLERYRDLVECHGLESLKFLPYTDSHVFDMAAEMLDPKTNILLCAAKFAKDSFEELVSQYVAASKHADVLFGCSIAGLNLALYTTAQAAKKPFFFLAHDPLSIMPTTEWSFDPSTFRVTDHGAFTNKINTAIMPFVVGFLNTINPFSLIRQYRNKLGLSTPWPFMSSLDAVRLAEFPTFCTWDQTLFPMPKDISSHWEGVGFLETKNEMVDKAKKNHPVFTWIAQRKCDHPNRRLIYAGSGSFDHHDRKFFTDMLIDACEQLGLDVVTLPTTVDERQNMSEFVHVAKGDLPHDILFEMCEVVIHHGGAGTAQQVIRSGTPGICCPAMGFQALWGHALTEYGAGALVTHEEMKVNNEQDGSNRLMAVMDKVLSDDIVKAKSLQLGKLSKKYRGTELVANKVLAYLSAMASPGGAPELNHKAASRENSLGLIDTVNRT